MTPFGEARVMGLTERRRFSRSSGAVRRRRRHEGELRAHPWPLAERDGDHGDRGEAHGAADGEVAPEATIRGKRTRASFVGRHVAAPRDPSWFARTRWTPRSPFLPEHNSPPCSDSTSEDRVGRSLVLLVVSRQASRIRSFFYRTLACG